MDENKNIPLLPEAFLVLIGVYFFFVMINLVFSLYLPLDPEILSQRSFQLKVFFVLGELSLIVIPVIYLKKRKSSLPEMFRWQRTSGRILWLTVPVGLGATVIFDELDRLINLFFPASEEFIYALSETMKAHSPGEFLLLFLGVVISAAVIEESIFRGFLQGVMEHRLNVTRAVIYGSLAWTIFHMNPQLPGQSVPIFLFGIVAGYLSWRTHSIYPGVICHGINNGIAILYYNINFEEALPAYEWQGHVSPFVLIIAVIMSYQGIKLIDKYYLTENFSSSSNNNDGE